MPDGFTIQSNDIRTKIVNSRRRVIVNLISKAMKKLFVNPVIVLTLIASLLFVSSCEEAADVVDADLIGTWDIGQASVDVKVGPVKLMDFLMSTLSYGEEAAQVIVDEITSQFLDIGGGTVTFNTDYSYLMSKSQFEESGTWNLEGNKLYLNVSENMDEDPITVQSMNSSAAVFAWEEEEEIKLEEGIPSFTATIIFELNLDKQ